MKTEDTKHLITDAEAAWLREQPETGRTTAGNYIAQLLDTREALIRALEREHKDSRCPCYYGMGGCESDALLDTLRGESND